MITYLFLYLLVEDPPESTKVKVAEFELGLEDKTHVKVTVAALDV